MTELALPVGTTEHLDVVGAVVTDVTVYSTTWCGSCKRLKAQMTREGIAFTDIDIEKDSAAADYVASVNNGAHFVPTVVVGDSPALPNPSLKEVKARLTAATTE